MVLGWVWSVVIRIHRYTSQCIQYTTNRAIRQNVILNKFPEHFSSKATAEGLFFTAKRPFLGHSSLNRQFTRRKKKVFAQEFQKK